jgi:hypothetical protein
LSDSGKCRSTPLAQKSSRLMSLNPDKQTRSKLALKNIALIYKIFFLGTAVAYQSA